MKRSASIAWLSVIAAFLIIGLPLAQVITEQSPSSSDKTKQVRVGVYHNPPKLLLEGERISGIHGDLLNYIAEQNDWQLQPVVCQWQQCLQWLESGRIDLLPDVAANESRRQRFDFHEEPALLSWSQLYALPRTNLVTLMDLDERSVAVLESSVQQGYLRQIAVQFEIDIRLVPVSSYDAGFLALEQGQVDAVATNQFFGSQKVADTDVVMTPIMFLPSQLYFATTAEKNSELLSAIDASLNQLKNQSDSAYYAIIEHWNGNAEKIQVPIWLWVTLTAVTLVSLLLLAFSWLLKKSIREKTYALQESESRLETILNSVDAFIFIKDRDLKYQYVNRKVADLFGGQHEDVIGLKDQDFFESTSAEQLTINDHQVLETGRRLAQYELNKLQGEEQGVPIWSVKVPLKNSQGEITGLCGIWTDISEYEQLKSQLRQLAYFDVLTGLANRRWLLEDIHSIYNAEQGAASNALVLIDIDKFKVVNDSLGHEYGDELLKTVAVRLELELRHGDTVGRLASDEFFILLKQLPDNVQQRQNLLQQRLHDIRERLGEPYRLSDVEYHASFSFGAGFFAEAESADSLLKTVDLAVAKAKANGGNKIQFFDPALQQSFNQRHYLETELQKAIKAGQLQIHLQPQFQLTDQLNCTGFEALLRWYHPQLGQVSPAQFIPVAENSGLMPQLHSLVLAQAIDALEQLQHHPLYSDCVVAINISAGQFKQDSFLPELKKAVQQSPVAHKLELELTESILVDDSQTSVTIMKELNHLGLQFSLDDFGTGYSSLSYLKRLPLKQLKIDQSFVRDLMNDDNDTAIVRTIIALANSLQLEVLAEGVETKEEQQKLSELGCSRYQGYLLGRPQPLAHWLQQ